MNNVREQNGTIREHFRLFPRGQNQQEEGNMEHPLSIEGSVPLFRSPDAGVFSKKLLQF